MATLKIGTTDRFWDGVPNGKKVQQWFRRQIECIAGDHLGDAVTSLEQMEDIVDHFCDGDGYMFWHTHDRYSGRGFASGYWMVDEKAVVVELSKALADTIASIDEWLALLHAGILPAAAEERSALVLLKGKAFDRWHKFTLNREPRTCRSCKATFRGRGRYTCDACIDRMVEKRKATKSAKSNAAQRGEVPIK